MKRLGLSFLSGPGVPGGGESAGPVHSGYRASSQLGFWLEVNIHVK